MGEGTESIVHSQAAARKAERDSPKVVHEHRRRSFAKWPLPALKPMLQSAAVGLGIPVIVIAGWQLASSAGFVSAELLSSPAAILKALLQIAGTGELTQHLGISLQRAGIGFLIGGALGILLGLLAGIFRSFGYLLDPSIQILRLVPHLAIAPLIILWFGFGEVSKVAIIITGSFFPLYINTFIGIRSADSKLLEVGKMLDFDPYQRLKHIILPSALPHLLLGIRLSLGAAWIGLVVAELIGSQSGIGFLINNAKQNGNTELIFVGILLFAVAGKLIDSLVKLLEQRLLRWQDRYQG